MQKAHNELLEITWEITDNCYQDCSYCGSKDIINLTLIKEKKIKHIIDSISYYPPKEINISGGNPLLVSSDVHKYLTTTLHDAGVICKLIINPFNVRGTGLSYYDWVGVSINTLEELNEFETWNDKNNKTIITNFNTDNIFLFTLIETMVITYNLIWQVQYTMYSNTSPKAIYTNPDAKEYLFDKISKSNAKITVADNMNNGLCSAGKNSLGILANGDVIPCLSMRSWESKVKPLGNLHEHTLDYIWRDLFVSFRCSEFECCKDKTNCQSDELNVKKIKQNILPKITSIPVPSIDRPFNPNMIMVYGVVRGLI